MKEFERGKANETVFGCDVFESVGKELGVLGLDDGEELFSHWEDMCCKYEFKLSISSFNSLLIINKYKLPRNRNPMQTTRKSLCSKHSFNNSKSVSRQKSTQFSQRYDKIFS